MRNICSILLLITLYSPPLIGNTFTDSRGRNVQILSKPTKIVSTSLAGDEILLELLRRQKQSHRLIAVSTLAGDSKYSNISKEVSSIKGRAGDELENILAMKPDLVILASYNRPSMIRRLDKSNVPTFVLGGFNSFADIQHSILEIGKLVRASKEAKALAEEFRKETLELIATAKITDTPITLLNYSSNHTLNGKNTTFDSIVSTAGALNLAKKIKINDKPVTGWAKVSIEKLATLNPDYIVAIGNPKNPKKVIEEIKNSLGYKSMPAVKKGHIIIVPGNIMLSVSHHAIKASRIIHKAIWKK
jgi:iron complex transport system substrate-binding protein